jgi:hypothetical protein
VVTITTPNAASVGYSLAAGGNSAAVTPVANIPVFVMGDETTTGNVGSSDMTVVNSAGHDNELVWNGIESGGGGFTSSFSQVVGRHMMFIDLSHQVDLQVNSNTSFRVHNAASATRAGNVTLIW